MTGELSVQSRTVLPVSALFEYDRQLGVQTVIGADEAGRGCLAGPIVAAAVKFDYLELSDKAVTELSKLNDSKKLSEKRRRELYPLILRHASDTQVVVRSAQSIDRVGLHKTNLEALRTALLRLAEPGCICLSDGYAVASMSYEQMAITKGDSTSAAIAAASVIAKVTRDRYMRQVASKYPQWGFDQHVGYASAIHRDAIIENGVTPLHRMSFNSTAYTQLTLA